MCRRITVFLLAVSLLLGGMCSAQAGALSREELYQSLQRELHSYFDDGEVRPLEMVVADFDGLGSYRKSAFFSYYVSILRDTELAFYEYLPLYTELIRLDEDFCKLLEEEGFPTVDEVEAYALGCQAEAADNWPAAIAYYQESIAVLDSVRRMARLRLAGPTPMPTPEPTPTPAPVTLIAEADKGCVLLYWESLAGSEAVYYVQRREGLFGTWLTLCTVTDQEVYVVVDDGISDGVRYSYRVTMALGPFTQTSGTAEVVGIAPTPTPSPTPAQVTLDGRMNVGYNYLSWRSPVKETAEFAVQRRLGSSGSWTTLTTLTTHPNDPTLSYADYDLKAGSWYTYRVVLKIGAHQWTSTTVKLSANMPTSTPPPTPTPRPRSSEPWEIDWYGAGVSRHTVESDAVHIGGINEGVYPIQWERGRNRFPVGEVICFRGTLCGNGTQQRVTLGWRVTKDGRVATGERMSSGSYDRDTLTVWARSMERGDYCVEFYYFLNGATKVIGRYYYSLY